MKKLVIVSIVILFSVVAGQGQKVKIKFTSESDQFAAATAEYQALWKGEGDRMIAALEKVSGMKFKETEFETIVFEGVSRSGQPGGSPMKMRASYAPDTKKATLIHEIGHRHIHVLTKRPAGLDEHSVLNLILYDVWTDLYGKKLADEQVAIERDRRGPYPAAWDYALGMSRKERKAKFREIVRSNR